MNAIGDAGSRVWADAVLAAALCAIDPVGLGGVALRARAGPVRDRWLEVLRAYLPPEAPVRTVPLHISDGRLLGGLDLTATLQTGRPVAERGVLTEVHGGVAILAMAERISGATAARITAALDRGEIAVERDGLALRVPARFGVIALDEGAEADEQPPPALLDRLAFHLDLETVSVRELLESGPDSSEVADARARLSSVEAGDAIVEALTATAMALGIDSLRAVHLALRATCAVAALAGRDVAEEDDAATAGRLVFAPRATRLPAPPPDDEAADETPPPEPEAEAGDEDEEDSEELDRPLEDMVLAAVQAALPAALLAQLARGDGGSARGRTGGRAGALQHAKLRGRPAGTRRGEPRGGARLNVVETLRNAAPWQPLRRREAGRSAASSRIDVRPEDFRVTRFKQRAQTTTIFVVDASGSSALNRLAEAKGAVELLLAESYVRRDQVALIAFRGLGAELLLPPTRSLVRAKRSLAGLPGGGGTPLAAGIDAAVELADAVRRKGDTPSVILLTDGRANVGRDGNPGRAQAETEALTAARRLRLAGFGTILLDTSPRPQMQAEKLAQEMGAKYLPLPYADAATLSLAIRAVSTARATPIVTRGMTDGLRWDFEGRDWPNREASRFVDAGGLRWHVQQMGSGPVILLAHGTGAATHSWRALMPLLAQRFTVVAPDLPGHGFTELPPASRLSLPGIAEALAALLDALGVRPVLAAGHSAGAAIAARMSLDQRLALAGLMSLNGALLPLRGIPGYVFSPMARLLASSSLVPRLFAWRAADPVVVERLVRGTGSTLEAAGLEWYGRLIRSPGHAAAALDMMANWDVRPLERELPNLKPRLMQVVGTNDLTVPPAEADRVLALLPQAQIVPLAGAGHLAHEERPTEVAALAFRFAEEIGVLGTTA